MSPSTTSNAGSSTSPLLAWGRLLRLSLAPTAIADIVAGAVFGAGGWPDPWKLGALVAASLCVYHGAMALNDWSDRGHDARTRPERPIPSGAVSARAALALAIVLLVAGAALAWSVSARSGLVLSVVAGLATLYDLAGRGAWTGPLLLGLCRAGNLASGMFVLGGEATSSLLLLAAGYGAYVFFLSRLGRMEDGEEIRLGKRPARLLGAGALCQLVPLFVGGAWVVLLATARLAALALRRESWSRASVLQAMGSALRLLLVYSSGVAWIGGGWSFGLGLLLVGYPLAWALRQVFPPS